MSQHIGAPAKPVVAVGDTVKEGQLIAEAAGFVSANVYSSVSGTVKGIVSLPTATGGKCDHIEIENDFRYDKVTLPPLVNPDKGAVVARVKEAGIVGMGGATFPTHVKLSPSKPVDTLIINAAECEPYITCDYRLLLERTDEVISGIKHLMTALGVDKAYIGIEANKPEAIKNWLRFAPKTSLLSSCAPNIRRARRNNSYMPSPNAKFPRADCLWTSVASWTTCIRRFPLRVPSTQASRSICVQ